MSSAAKLAANRANATLSKGPADTSRTRFNGLAHGLASKQTVIRGEDQQEYDTFAANLGNELCPGSPTENILADRIVAAAWRLKRFTRVEASFFNNRIESYLEDNADGDPDAALASLFTDPVEMARMRLFLRYQTSVQREYDKATQEFRKIQTERLKPSLERTWAEMRLASSDSDSAAAAAAGPPVQAPGGFCSKSEIALTADKLPVHAQATPLIPNRGTVAA